MGGKGEAEDEMKGVEISTVTEEADQAESDIEEVKGSVGENLLLLSSEMEKFFISGSNFKV